MGKAASRLRLFDTEMSNPANSQGPTKLVVIGAGWGRTGTMSLKLALEKLYGTPCHHMKEVLLNLNQGGLWEAALRGKPDWTTIFKGYETMVDFPGTAWYEELMQAYPEAKVVLSVRDSG